MTEEKIRKAFEADSDICFDDVEFIDGRYVYYDVDAKSKKTHQAIHAAWIGFKAGIEHQQKQIERLESALKMAIETFDRYEMDVDEYPTIEHIKLMNALNEALKEQGND